MLPEPDSTLPSTDAGGETVDHDPSGRTTGRETDARDTAPDVDSHRPTEPMSTTGTDGWIGTTIAGRYSLRERLGEGGMGIVYLAEQTEPIRRQVALKLIRRGMDSREALGRFEAERQALALMDHPCIARVFDGGATPSGHLYFVMELVRGVPIHRYCDEQRLNPAARLELFIDVCQAVQHAHQKGIIHRDLKPSNVLVTEMDGRPLPKLIDFGVAKAIEQRLTDESFGDTGAIVGTPAYMSPEQADPASMDIDTRTDIYALGVMLYELLTGSPPIDAREFRRGAVLEMLRMVREVDPPRPSTRLSSAQDRPTIAACRATEPSQLVRWLQGDIEWIVMKALEKDRGRRYASANSFADDLRRFLTDEPVVARPPSRGYRLRKFVRRNRGAVLATSLVLVAMVGGIVGTSLGLIEARAQQRAADRAREVAVKESEARERARQAEAEQRALAEAANRQAFDALKSFTDELMTKLLGGKDELTDVERSVLRKAQEQWEVFARSRGDSVDARVIRAEGAAELAGLQSKLGMNAEAEANDRAALRLHESLAREFPEEPRYQRRLAMSHQNLGATLRSNGSRAEAEVHFREAVQILRRLAAAIPENANARRKLAVSLISLGNAERDREDWPGAEAHYREAIAIQGSLAEAHPDDSQVRNDEADSHWGLAFTLKRAERNNEAEAEYRRALDLKRRLAEAFPDEVDHRHDAANLGRELGVFLYDQGRDEEGARPFPEAIKTLEQLAAEFPSLPIYRLDLSRCLRDFGRVLGYLDRRLEAEERLREAVRLGEQLAAESPTVLRYQSDLGLSYGFLADLIRDGDNPAESLPWYDKAIGLLTAAHERDRQAVLTRDSLSKRLDDRAVALDLLNRHTESVATRGKAIELATPGRRPLLRAARALSRARDAQLDLALAELDEVTRSNPTEPILWYFLARVHALAVAADHPRKTAFETQAVDELRKALELGLGQPSRRMAVPDLDSLRTRDDFKHLLETLDPTS